MHTDFGYFEEKKIGKPYDVRLLKRLYPFSKPYRLFLFCSIMLVVLITLLDLSLPYITKIAIDRYIVPQKSLKTGQPEINNKHKIRYLSADPTDQQIKTVISKYPKLFKTSGSISLIRFEDLARLPKQDIRILRKNDFAGLAMVTTVFIVAIITNFIFNFVQVYLMEYTGHMIMHDLRIRIFTHIQNLSVSFFTRNPVGRLVTRATNDVQNMHDLFTSVITFVFKDIFLLVGIAAVLLLINWHLALISFTVLPFVLYASSRFSDRARDAFRTLRIKIAEINIRFSETITGIKVIQLFLQEKKNYNGFKKLNHEYYMAGMKQIHVFAIFMPVIELLGSVAISVVIYYGGSGVLAGSISLGALVAFISYMKMFFRPIRDIAEKYNILQNAMASAERIFLILDSRDNIPQPRSYTASVHPAKPDASISVPEKILNISLENVFFEYNTNQIVLEDISFGVDKSETLAVVGPTGSGKTSIINLIVRFYDPVSGRILLNGRNIKNIPTHILREKIALVMQDPFLFSESIRDNILLGDKNISEQQMQNILRNANCKDLIERLPDGLDTVLSESGASISSGERQLISIARAFAKNPDLIILDEATSYIDSQTEYNIQKALHNLMANRTSIVVAHRLSTARHANRIIVLNKGRIIESGNHTQLIAQRGFYFRLNQLQN